MSLRSIVPKRFRLRFKLLFRWANDIKSGQLKKFATNKKSALETRHRITLKQSIIRNDSYINKCFNIQLAADKINGLQLNPGQIFSFWKLVGEPNALNNFKIGRNIIAGKLTEDYGGGLCQVSGILYHVALKAGLQIEERHHHSVDIYTEETRFSPLGADATIVYGYKDLRFSNPYPFPLLVILEMKEAELNVFIESNQILEEHEITFEETRSENEVLIITKNGFAQTLATSTYIVNPAK